MSLEFAVHVTIPITEQLNSGNLISEARWERVVVEALLQSPEVSAVYLTEPMWKSPYPMPDKLHPYLPKDKEKDVILIVPASITFKYHTKAILMNMYGYPPPFTLDPFEGGKDLQSQFDDSLADLGKNLILIYPGFEPCDMLPGFENNYDEMKLPRVPDVIEHQDNYNKNILMWPHKDTFLRLDLFTSEYIDIFSWVAKKLRADSSLELHFLTALEPGYATHCGWGSIENRFWGNSASAPLHDVKNRVYIHGSLDWHKVCQMYDRVKLVLPSPNINRQLGGPPIEAARYGVPFVGVHVSLFSEDSNYIGVKSFGCPEMYEYLERLMSDHEFYSFIGNSYREFARGHYTYSAFVNRLFGVLKEREIL